MIESTYIELIEEYGLASEDIEILWNEIESNYSNPKRHYHNLDHLEDLLEQLILVQDEIKNWPVLLFTFYYHDIVYDSTKNDNEEKSAELAVKRLIEIGLKENEINLCYSQIVATKGHAESQDSDTNFFTDADLSILGRPPADYKSYYEKIRKEYAVYPDSIYIEGRKKVVQDFLSMHRIYKTEYFYAKYEKQARKNLARELELL